MSAKPIFHVCLRLQRPGFLLDVDLHLAAQGMNVVQGPSGSGKTTLLRCIAGLDQPDAGLINVHGKLWLDAKHTLPAHQRPIGYVFQEDRLFEHLNARKNILFGCQDRRTLPPTLLPVIQALDIAHLLERKPGQLSGGERQRVAIARALAVEPELLLMDEPLSALDESRRHDILALIERIHALRNIPIVYVTHAQSEADRLGGQRVLMAAGKIVPVAGGS